MPASKRLECFGTATSQDACLQCPDNSECAKVTCSKVKKRISDVFDIRIGEDWRTQSGFICDSTRKDAKLPEPYDDHRINDWLISGLQLQHFHNYRIRVTVTLVQEIEKVKQDG